MHQQEYVLLVGDGSRKFCLVGLMEGYVDARRAHAKKKNLILLDMPTIYITTVYMKNINTKF